MSGPGGAKTRRCDCGVEIFFAVNDRTRAKIPLVARPVTVYRVAQRGGETVCSRVEIKSQAHDKVQVYLSHFVDCPDRKKHRRG